ncbi:hypothetical protein LOTGIDRAFT_235319 [Lottia gigantea]|uniref:Uncharacterized protein n=1 Tax=Lottia gigantea TaxID=225164 RepID=V3ZQ98_LOTGI|nr:hypothetical protein LOTGIDRAFT_235319 [Lottia gigantea]ESO86507.1 hypothetical protein LOTGIDRAFT_235319 [Lottia gigantea]
MPSGSKRNKKDKSINKLMMNSPNGSTKVTKDKESQKPQQTMFDASLKTLDKLFKESSATDILKLGPRPELLGMTPLAMAASVGNVEAVVKLLAAEADVNEKSDKNTTALMQVIHSKNVDIAHLLLKQGARLTDKNTSGDNAFMMAVWSGEADLVNKMWPYRQDLDINHQNQAGNTALHLAASKKWENGIQFLLTNGADTNLQNKAGFTPLMTAVKQGDMKAIEKLVNHSYTDLLIEDSEGQTALCKAILNERGDAAQVITTKLSGLDKIVLSQNLVTKLLKPPEDCDNQVDFYEETLYPVLLTMCKFDEFRSSLCSCKLIGHVINIAAKHVTSSQIVTASCFICTLLMFKYSSGTDERFVDQFMVCKGPEFVLHVLKIYENLENGLSQDSEVMASCILTLVPVSDSTTGKEWIKQNNQSMSKYIEKLKVSNIMSKLTFIDEGCRCKLKIAWKEFIKLYEDTIDHQRQQNINQLLEEEEREKLKKAKKKDRRKTKRKNQNKKQKFEEGMIDTAAINENNHSKITPQIKDKKTPKNTKYQPLNYDNFDDKSDLDEPLEFGFTVDLDALTEDEWVTVSTKKPITKPAPKLTPQKQAITAKQEMCKPSKQRPKNEKVESIKIKDGNLSWADIARSNIQSIEKQPDLSSPNKSRTESPATSVHDYSLEGTNEDTLSEEENVATIEAQVPKVQVSDPNPYEHDFPTLNDRTDSIWGPCPIDTDCSNSRAAEIYSASSTMDRQADNHATSCRPPPGFSEIRPTENWWDNMNTLKFPPFGFQPNQTTTTSISPNASSLSPLNQMQFMASFIEEQQRLLSASQSNGGSSATMLPNQELLSSKPVEHTFQQNETTFPVNSVGGTNVYGQMTKTCINSLVHNIPTVDALKISHGMDSAHNLPQPKQLWPDHSNDFDGYLENIWKNDTILSSGIQQTLRGPLPGQAISDTVLYPSHLRDDGSVDPETSSDYSTQSSDTCNTDCFPSFHDNKDYMTTSFLFEELAKDQVKKHDRKLSEYPLFRNSPNHYNTDYYKSLYGLMSKHQEADKDQEADSETSPLPEWALEPDNPDYEITSMPSFSQFPNGSMTGYVSRKWKGRLNEIRRLPEKMKRQIGSIVIPLQSALYNINENGNSVILGHLLDGTEVAVKVVDPKLYSVNSELMERLQAAEIKHNFLLKYLAIGETSNKQYIACELCDYTLEEYMHITCLNFQHDALSANKLSWQLLKGLHYLHTEFLLPHGNLKPQNIYVDFDGKLRIGGYGVNKKHRLCRMSTAPCKKLKHEIWRATECLGDSENTVSTTSSDVQVAGMLIHYILTGGKHPYGENPYEIEVNICQNWGQMTFISEEANDLISAMLFSDISARPTLEQCLGHPFFWSDEMKFRLVLIAGSDVLKEMKTGVPVTGNGSTTMIDFLNVVPAENISQDWMADLDPVILKDMRSFRQYKNSLAELVLFLYNCCLHFDKMSPAAREVMDDPCRYFPAKFPNLFMAVYRAIKVSDRVNRTCYKPFYSHCS